MPIITETNDSNKKPFQQPHPGLQLGICIRMVDLGSQPTDWGLKRQLRFTWELPDDLMADGRPLTISKQINLAIGDLSKLTELALASGQPKPSNGYDPSTLVGTACNLNLNGYTNKKGNAAVSINGFSPLMRNQVVPPMVNPPLVFDLDRFTQKSFDSLGQYDKGLIMASPQYQGLGLDSPGKPLEAYPAQEAGRGYPTDQDEEIPF